MTTPYTASDNLASVKLKAWVSESGSLSDAQLLVLLQDALRSFVVPFVKRARDEWFVKGGSTLTPNSAGRIAIPNSVGSTVRTVSWVNNGYLVPLTRIEPENALPMLGAGGSTPVGFTLKGYQLQIIPAGVGSIQIFIEFMERPDTMVLEQDASKIGTNNIGDLWNCTVPLSWQGDPPATLAVISPDSPFSALGEVAVLSVNTDSIEFSGAGAALIEQGVWVADIGETPFPNIPIELHPLLQQSTIVTLFAALGDKRNGDAMKLHEKMERELLATIAPRTQGNARPIVNRNGPGWGTSRWGRW